jgi:methanogenic corrinoid protein MtbC1
MSLLDQIKDNLMKGKANEVKTLVTQAMQEKIMVVDILNKGLLDGMSVIGDKFKKNEVYVPEVLIAARAMKAGMEILKPALAEAKVQPKGIVVIGTVKAPVSAWSMRVSTSNPRSSSNSCARTKPS